MNMCRHPSIVAAAAFAVGFGAFTLSASAQDMTGGRPMAPSDRTTASPSTMPADRSSAMAPDAHDIRAALAKTTEDAVSKNSFSTLYKCFNDADRDRIGAGEKNITRADWDKLNGRLEQFQKDWKAKYNQDFDIKKDDVVFNDQFRIIQGEIGEAQPAGARMGGTRTGDTVRDRDVDRTGTTPGAGAGAGAGAARDPGAPDTTPGPEANKVGGGETNREPGRNVAKVTFPESHGQPALFIPMIHELPDSWKIDVPDQVDARKLYDNLLKHVTMLDEQKDQWPADVNDAYRLVSHHVMMAVLDQDASSAGNINREGARPMDR